LTVISIGFSTISKFGKIDRQNEQIEALLAPPGQVDEEEEKRLFRLKIAIYGSAAANVCLVILQVVAAVASGSLSILATAADALMGEAVPKYSPLAR
jgi:hypothetical protein